MGLLGEWGTQGQVALQTKYQILGTWYLELLGKWGSQGQVALQDRPKFQRSPQAPAAPLSLKVSVPRLLQRTFVVNTEIFATFLASLTLFEM